MSNKEFILFCDESDRHGRYYSNFYGGVLVGSSQYQRVTKRLNDMKSDLNLHQEVKWEKVTEQYLEKYIELMRVFFEEVTRGNVRVRIMFRQNAHLPRGLSREQVDWEYYLLYYQFVKHAFGLEHANENLHLRLYFDQFPDTAEKTEQFKETKTAPNVLHSGPFFHFEINVQIRSAYPLTLLLIGGTLLTFTAHVRKEIEQWHSKRV